MSLCEVKRCKSCFPYLQNLHNFSCQYDGIITDLPWCTLCLGVWINYYNLRHFTCSQIWVLWFRNSVYLCDGLITRPEEPTGSCMCIIVCDLETSKRGGIDRIWAVVSLKKEACNLYFLKDLHHCLSPPFVFQPNTKVSVGTYVSRYCGTVEAI